MAMMANLKHKQRTHEYNSIEPYSMANFADAIKRRFRFNINLNYDYQRGKWKGKKPRRREYHYQAHNVRKYVCERENSISPNLFLYCRFIAIYFSYVVSFNEPICLLCPLTCILLSVLPCVCLLTVLCAMLVFIHWVSKSNSSRWIWHECAGAVRLLCDEQKVNLCLSSHS